MKRIATYSLVALTGVAVAILVSGCASTRIKQLSGSEFVARAQQIEQISSFHWTTYIGSSHQKAYLEFSRPSLLYNIIGKETRTTVYWTDMSGLPEDIANQLRSGNPPWKPWSTETNMTERSIEVTEPN